MTLPVADDGASSQPRIESGRDALGPEPADWAGIARQLREFSALAAKFFALPRSDKAALLVIVCWWPIIGFFFFIVYITIGGYLFGLAVATVGMSRPLPDRRPAIITLVVCSCVAAGVAVIVRLVAGAELDSPMTVVLASVSAGAAIAACIMLFRRHLQHSDRWQPRRPSQDSSQWTSREARSSAGMPSSDA